MNGHKISTFNRTIIELKLLLTLNEDFEYPSTFNRTIIELKLVGVLCDFLLPHF